MKFQWEYYDILSALESSLKGKKHKITYIQTCVCVCVCVWLF
jgi:hypothetical protein